MKLLFGDKKSIKIRDGISKKDTEEKFKKKFCYFTVFSGFPKSQNGKRLNFKPEVTPEDIISFIKKL